MKINEKKIFNVLNTSSLIIQQKKKNSKKSLQALINNVSFYNDYYFVSTYKRFTRFNLLSYVNVNKLIEFYNLFVIRAHRKLITSILFVSM